MASEANGAVIVFESLTGRVVAVLVDNGYLTLMRTAAAGGFAVQQFAPAEIDTLGIVGAGKQAVLQAQAACLVRQPRSVLLWARNQAKAARAVAAISQETSRPVQLATEVDELASADVIIATTGARLPVLRLRDTTGASLILAIGSDAPGKRELHTEVIAAATAVVTDLGSQSFTHGELQGLPPETLAGRLYSYADGYTPSAGTTVVDHTGTGLQDLYVVDVVMQLVGSG